MIVGSTFYSSSISIPQTDSYISTLIHVFLSCGVITKCYSTQVHDLCTCALSHPNTVIRSFNSPVNFVAYEIKRTQ